jgi:hypothetical protein
VPVREPEATPHDCAECGRPCACDARQAFDCLDCVQCNERKRADVTRHGSYPQEPAPPASSPPERSEGWQPIETAPKDGTAVLGYVPGRQGFFSRQDVAVVAWIETRWQSVNSGHWLTSDVTHWMPLPAPPEPSNG